MCDDLFGRSYDKLSSTELVDCINELQMQTGFTSPGNVETQVASKQQLKMLRFYSLCCAINYCPFHDVKFDTEDTCEHLTGNDLRPYLFIVFEKKKYVPPYLFRLMYERWINPKSHEFLIEGEYKKFVKHPERLRYENLSPRAVQYLIKRFSSVYQNLAMEGKVEAPDYILN